MAETIAQLAAISTASSMLARLATLATAPSVQALSVRSHRRAFRERLGESGPGDRARDRADRP